MSILCLLTLTILISWAEATFPWSIPYESKILRFSVTQLGLLMCVCKAFYFESADAWSLQLQEISGLVIKDRLMSTLIYSSRTSDWRIWYSTKYVQTSYIFHMHMLVPLHRLKLYGQHAETYASRWSWDSSSHLVYLMNLPTIPCISKSAAFAPPNYDKADVWCLAMSASRSIKEWIPFFSEASAIR